MDRFEVIFQALNDANVRYVVVGGVAVNLHGHARFTKDLDLVVELAPDEARKAIDTLSELGYRPTIPVAATDFADPAVRERWVSEKHMIVFQLYHDAHRMTIDLFIRYPIDFGPLWDAAGETALARTAIRVASLDHLIQMKRDAGRPQDMIDVQWLETIREMKRGQAADPS